MQPASTLGLPANQNKAPQIQRLLLIIANLRAGGRERQVALLANGLAQRADFDITLFLLDGQAPVAYELDPAVQLTHSGAAGYRGVLRSLWLLPSLSRQHDLTLGFMDLGNLLAQLTRRGPLVWNLTTTGVPAKWTSRLIHRLARSRSAGVELAIGNAQSVVEFYQRVGFRCREFAVVPNALDTERFKPHPESRLVVRRELGIPDQVLLLGAVARAHPDKRHDLLLDVLIERQDVHLLCVGDNVAEDQRLDQLIRQRGLEARVTRLNARPDIERLLPAIDIGCCVSDREGLPNSVLELMASGVPCLGTRVGGLPDLLQDVGHLVAPGNLTELLAAVAALDDPLERARLGALSRSRVLERYDLATTLDRWLDVLNPLLSNQATG